MVMGIGTLAYRSYRQDPGPEFNQVLNFEKNHLN
jgi:OOP family OmpA-OmpF porin